jgi:hypothetical protein
VLYEGGGDVIFLPIWGYCYCNWESVIK